jgi:hypothetical protein
MNIISGLAERAAIVLAIGSRKLLDFHGRRETARIRARSKIPLHGDRIPLDIQPDELERRATLLLDFIRDNELDTLVIVGCAYGRELLPLSKRTNAKLIGLDLSEEALEACRGYGIGNADFHELNVEDAAACASFWPTVKSERVGIYFCETAPYILPEKLVEFTSQSPAVAVQYFEPTWIDMDRFGTGMQFSFRDNHWRHNYWALLKRAGFTPYRNEFLTRRPSPDNQPMWLIAGVRT